MITRVYLIICHVVVFLLFWITALWHICDRGFLRWEVVVLVGAASLPFMLPLLATYVKGVGKDGVLFHDIGLQELLKLKQKVADAGLLSSAKVGNNYPFQMVAAEDPNLALAGLRIEIEKRLLRIAESRGIERQKKGVGMLLRLLVDRQLLSPEQRSVLEDLLGLLNSAVHGAKVTPDAVSWAMSIGPELLQSLDEKAEQSKVINRVPRRAPRLRSTTLWTGGLNPFAFEARISWLSADRLSPVYGQR